MERVQSETEQAGSGLRSPTTTAVCTCMRCNADRYDSISKLNHHRAKMIDRLRSALGELHAMVVGECPSLLNEDSGGSARLDLEIRDILANTEQAIAKTNTP